MCKSVHRGFTLVELATTLTVVIILIGLVVPSCNDFIQQVRLTNATYALHSAMNLARSEAIKRNSKVDLIAHQGSWKNGWSVSANNQVIINHEPLHRDLSVDTTMRYQTTPYISYTGSGRTRTESHVNTPQMGTIRLSIGKHVRLIIVNFLGRVRVCNPAFAPDKSCISTALGQ